MKVATRTEDSIEVFSLSGRLDAAAAPALRKKLQPALQKDHCQILFNLENVDFIDSSGLAVFVNVLQSSRAQGGNVALARPSPPVRSILKLTRLYRIMQVFDHERDAMAVFNPAGPATDG